MNQGNMEAEKSALIKTAFDCFDNDNLPQAEAYCRYLLSAGHSDEKIHLLLGLIAQRLSLHDAAISYFRNALEMNSNNPVTTRELANAQQSAEAYSRTRQAGDNGEKFLLIKAWGYGFWADIDHVLGQLLLAELTNRTPVVYWGKNSLFGNEHAGNAFTLYFEPVSGYSISDLRKPELAYYPEKWDQDNLLDEDLYKWSGPHSRMAGIYYLARDEDVAVSDFHTYVKDLVPWIPANHPLFGMDPQAIYRYLFRKYLHVRPELQQRIHATWENLLKGKRALAVHIRGSDKIHEDRNLHATHQQYHDLISSLLKQEPDLKLFLLTDSAPILDEYIHTYGDRLVYTNSERSADDVGVHLKQSDQHRIGTEVLMDVYLASTCDYFLGIGSSNVSTSILHTRDWAQGHCMLLGHNYLFGVHLGMHNRQNENSAG